ncbi:hypothetical protein V8E54_013250 [Elaphomyces granulatus]
MILLFCWVCGDPQPFPVEISSEKTVGELKKAIVAEKPNRFRGIDADVLNLWKKIIPTSDRKRFQPSDLKEEDELDVTWRIDNYFEEAPQARRIHIIIKAPEPIGGE